METVGDYLSWVLQINAEEAVWLIRPWFFLPGVMMTMDVKAETQKNTSPQECAGCGKKITERLESSPHDSVELKWAK